MQRRGLLRPCCETLPLSARQLSDRRDLPRVQASAFGWRTRNVELRQRNLHISRFSIRDAELTQRARGLAVASAT